MIANHPHSLRPLSLIEHADQAGISCLRISGKPRWRPAWGPWFLKEVPKWFPRPSTQGVWGSQKLPASWHFYKRRLHNQAHSRKFLFL